MTANNRKMAKNGENLTIIAGLAQIFYLELEGKIVNTHQNLIQ